MQKNHLIFIKIAAIGILSLVLLTGSGGLLSTSASTGSLRGSIPKQVFAFYYGWYNLTPDNWLNGRNGTNKPSVSGTPVLGFYNSDDATVIDTQINQAKSVGITGFIRSWPGVFTTFQNDDTQLLFQEASKLSFTVSLMYSAVTLTSDTVSKAAASVVSNLEYAMSNFQNSPAMYKINGNAVLFIYQVANLNSQVWSTAIPKVRAAYPHLYLIGDAIGQSYMNTLFDGYFQYTPSMPNVIKGMSNGFTNGPFTQGTFSSYYQAEQSANANNKLWFAPVRPGTDDVNNPSEPLHYYPRQNGATYQATWQLAEKSNPDAIIICSWNEWREGSGIEPNTGFPDYWSSPTQYLTLTQTYISQFVG